MLKKIFSVRLFLTVGLLVSVLFASYSIYYKITYWGFDVFPTTATSVWTIESQLTFTPTQDNITVKFARPSSAGEFKILDESVIAKGYDIQKSKDYFTLTAPAQTSQQDIYYRILIYDMTGGNGETKADKPKIPPLPVLSDHAMDVAGQILALAEQGQGDDIQKIIRLLNQNPPNETVAAFMPERKSAKDTAQMAVDLLAIRHIPARIVRGIRLSEGKKTFTPDVMLEAYTDNYWRVYDIETGQTGLPDNFVIFQHGDASLADVTGGMDSTIKYAVLKSITSSFKMAKHRAKNTTNEFSFDYSIYNLPISQQNAVKWLTIFPLAILIIVLLRNVIGIKTMGTFTPMLIALSLVNTGFYAGFISFCLIVGLGMAVRALLSRFNLLLVPRISSVVIFVILIMQSFAVIGYQWDLKIASSALFFPIIIMAWVIERASIIWEEEGLKNAAKEIFFSLLAAVITYFVIVNATIRHIMFAFDELNLVILFTVMLLGTYTGYRLTELKRFAPLVKKKSKR